MKQPEDTRTAELPGVDIEQPARRPLSLAELLRQRDELQHKIEHPGRGRRRGQRVGAYAGAVKVGSFHHQLRAKTGKTQAEFARLAGISERTLRTWEQGDPSTCKHDTHVACISALASLGVSYLAESQKRLQRRGAVRYRCPETGSTWSGRGLMPQWLRVTMESTGKRLADFAVTA